MNNNFSTKLVIVFILIVMVSLLAGSGCKGHIANPPAAKPVPEQPPSEQPPTDPPPTEPPPAVQPTPAQISVSSRQIVSGAVVLNSVSDQTVSIQNTGSISLNIGQIAGANPLASPFSIVSDSCSGKALQSAATCSFHVQFSPVSQGAFTDSFDIPSDAANEASVTIDVAGSGKALRTAINQVSTADCPSGILELIVTVTDQSNTLLTGLTATSFQLKENGVSQPIASVSQILTPVPVSVTMVLDYSGSMATWTSNVEAASRYFISLLNADDEAAVIKFATTYQLMQDFTSDPVLLTTAIDTAPPPIGTATHMYDTLWFAVETAASRQKNKVIVLISDGKDEDSQGVPYSVKTADEVIAYATGNAVAVYTVGLGDAVDAGVLNRLAGETGGQFYPITGVDQLAGVYESIRNILTGKYAVQYVTSLHGSTPITLNIDVLSVTYEGTAVGEFVGCP